MVYKVGDGYWVIFLGFVFKVEFFTCSLNIIEFSNLKLKYRNDLSGLEYIFVLFYTFNYYLESRRSNQAREPLFQSAKLKYFT